MCAIPQMKHTAASKTVSVISVLRISIAPSVSSDQPSAFVEAARQALLAAFLIDEGRLPALLAQIADPLAGTVYGDLHDHVEGLPGLGLVDRDDRGADRRLHPVGGAGETVGPRLDHRLALSARRDGLQRLQPLFGAHADVQHLLALASVPEH